MIAMTKYDICYDGKYWGVYKIGLYGDDLLAHCYTKQMAEEILLSLEIKELMDINSLEEFRDLSDDMESALCSAIDDEYPYIWSLYQKWSGMYKLILEKIKEKV